MLSSTSLFILVDVIGEQLHEAISPTKNHTDVNDEPQEVDLAVAMQSVPESSRDQVVNVADSQVIDYDEFLLTLVSMGFFFMAGVVIAVLVGVYCCRLFGEIEATADQPYKSHPKEIQQCNNTAPPSYDTYSNYSGGSGGRKLAFSAQMYHFELQKQRILDEERVRTKRNSQESGVCTISEQQQTGNAEVDGSGIVSDADCSFDESQSVDSYVVYECRGMASTDELEIVNPMFDEDLLQALTTYSNDGMENDSTGNTDSTGHSVAVTEPQLITTDVNANPSAAAIRRSEERKKPEVVQSP